MTSPSQTGLEPLTALAAVLSRLNDCLAEWRSISQRQACAMDTGEGLSKDVLRRRDELAREIAGLLVQETTLREQAAEAEEDSSAGAVLLKMRISGERARMSALGAEAVEADAKCLQMAKQRLGDLASRLEQTRRGNSAGTAYPAATAAGAAPRFLDQQS